MAIISRVETLARRNERLAESEVVRKSSQAEEIGSSEFED